MTNTTMTYTGTLAIEECYKCHIVFAMPKDLQQQARDRGETFYCPLGHGQVYSVTEVQRLREKVASEERRRKQADAQLTHERDQRQAAERRVSAYKGQVTKIRKRIGNGVCPCCQRHFTNVERHMATQHPDYADGEP